MMLPTWYARTGGPGQEDTQNKHNDSSTHIMFHSKQNSPSDVTLANEKLCKLTAYRTNPIQGFQNILIISSYGVNENTWCFQILNMLNLIYVSITIKDIKW